MAFPQSFLDELVAQGVEEEDTIKIGEYEFDYLY